jgi:hypothetical protein
MKAAPYWRFRGRSPNTVENQSLNAGSPTILENLVLDEMDNAANQSY